jgi:hypothetical protein
MKTTFSLCCGFVLLIGLAFGQSPERVKKCTPERFQYANSVQLELGGHGLYYSVNYERFLVNHFRFKTSLRVGASFYPKQTGIIPLWMPVLANEVISFGRHHMEIGLGATITRDNLWLKVSEGERPWNAFPTGRIGYRYQKPNGRLILGVAFTPLMEVWNVLSVQGVKPYAELHPLGGATIGYAF